MARSYLIVRIAISSPTSHVLEVRLIFVYLFMVVANHLFSIDTSFIEGFDESLEQTTYAIFDASNHRIELVDHANLGSCV